MTIAPVTFANLLTITAELDPAPLPLGLFDQCARVGSARPTIPAVMPGRPRDGSAVVLL